MKDWYGVKKKWKKMLFVLAAITLIISIYGIGAIHGMMRTAAAVMSYEPMCEKFSNESQYNLNFEKKESVCSIGANSSTHYSQLGNMRIYHNDSMDLKSQMQTLAMTGKWWATHEN